jgi:HD superfamily phosphohydrolase/serine/threonine protein kinase
MTTVEASQTTTFVSALEGLYKSKQEFKYEAPIVSAVLPGLAESLKPWSLLLPFAVGSTAIIAEVLEPSGAQKRVLKLARPRSGRIGEIVKVIRAEGHKLTALTHQNIIKVYETGEVTATYSGQEYSFPYFVMEYFEDVADLDDYIYGKLADLTADEVIDFLRDSARGLAYLHESGVIHCDIKPANILVAGGVARIADLGYAKNLPLQGTKETYTTTVAFTEYYAHPRLLELMRRTSDPNAARAPLHFRDLREAFDLYALGRSTQEILQEIRKRAPSKFGVYQWRYLTLFALRLLDGVDQRSSKDPLASDVLPGLPPPYMDQIKYQRADDALEDLEKLRNLMDLEGEIPELNPGKRKYIQLPSARAPLTPRVRAIVDHPAFARLRNVTQLGFVSLVYPGSSHSRFEHALGTFAHCCEMIRALWYDESNCLFRSLMTTQNLEAALLASLLHDIAQYPMAHDLAEIDSRFDHERFTEALFLWKPTVDTPSLADIVDGMWEIQPQRVIEILHPTNSEADLRNRILRSLISGPLDADKLDYLTRDCLHLGLVFGSSIDEERLYRNSTVVFGSGDGQHHPRAPSLDVAEIGILEKALAAADSLWRARRDLFKQVYWHHSVRSLKAMLAYAVRHMLRRMNADSLAEFMSAFDEFVRSPLSPANQTTRSEMSLRQPEGDEEMAALFGEEPSSNSVSRLSASDDALMALLLRFADEQESRIIQMIRARKLYQRLVTIADGGERSAFRIAYNHFRVYRLDGQLQPIEDTRRRWEADVISQVEASARSDRRIRDMLDAARAEAASCPVILVDIPVKALRESADDAPERLWYVPEHEAKADTSEIVSFPRHRASDIQIERESFDWDVGKIRVLAHPAWHHVIKECVSDAYLGLAVSQWKSA